jgi:hypothetical protein
VDLELVDQAGGEVLPGDARPAADGDVPPVRRLRASASAAATPSQTNVNDVPPWSASGSRG